MAPASQVAPPATLPADFNKWDAPAGGAPATLPADFSKWDEPTPPTSGPIGPQSGNLPTNAAPPEPSGITSGLGRMNQGINGIKKGLVSTARNIHDSNAAVAPSSPNLTMGPQGKPFPGVDTEAHSPDEQAGKFVEGMGEMATPIGKGSVAEGVKTLLPSAERSGAQLSRMTKYLKGVPVLLNETIPSLDRAAEISKAGGGPMGSAGNLLDRSLQPNFMDFPEARDYYPNISKLSAEERMSMKGPLRRQIGDVRQSFHNDLANTADKMLPPTQKGYLGQPMNGGKMDYENAIDEFHHASQLRDVGKTLVKKVLPAGGAIGAGKYAYDKLRGH